MDVFNQLHQFHNTWKLTVFQRVSALEWLAEAETTFSKLCDGILGMILVNPNDL